MHKLLVIYGIELPFKLDDGRVSLSPEILDYTTFAPIMQLKMRHILCWNGPYDRPICVRTGVHIKENAE